MRAIYQEYIVGVQARLKASNPLIHYITCSAHSLNLIGWCAAESCINAVSFFDFLRNFYKFFSASTKRWAKMKSEISHQRKNSEIFIQHKMVSEIRRHYSPQRKFCLVETTVTRFYVGRQ